MLKDLEPGEVDDYLLPVYSSSDSEHEAEAPEEPPPAAAAVTAAAAASSGQLHDSSDVGLCTALLSRGMLALPATSSFEPLNPPATNVPLSGAAATHFATHTTYELPCDYGAVVWEDRPREGLVDVVHRLTLQRRVSRPLNAALSAWGEEKERRGLEATERLMYVPPGRGTDASVNKTNVGGYQSYHDLFEDGADVDPACLTLRDLVDLALAECCPDAYAGGDAAKSDGRVEDGGSDGADAKPSPDADPSPGADGAAARRDGYAWLNVNRTPHSNFLHTHTFERWSGCYFVQEGEPNAPGFACPTSGHMVFRGGRRRRGHEADGGPAEGASHTYFAVPPTPGTLWLFGGTVPHCVMRTQLPPGVPEPESPRISIGVNWSDAVTPSPRPPLA